MRLRASIRVRVRWSFRQEKGVLFRVRVRVGIFLERRSGDRTRVDGVCDFEKVLPDQVCPSAKRD